MNFGTALQTINSNYAIKSIKRIRNKRGQLLSMVSLIPLAACGGGASPAPTTPPVPLGPDFTESPTGTFTGRDNANLTLAQGSATTNLTVNSKDGNDTITTGSGHDVINGAGGNDIIDAGDGNDTINAGEGNNEITDSAGDNTITTGGGSNTITVMDGNDTIITGAGNDTISAGLGNNIISAGAGDDAITTESGDDTITVSGGNNTISSGAGNDTIIGSTGIDTITSGDGNDIIRANLGADVVDAGAGDDIIVVVGTTGAADYVEGDITNPGGSGLDVSGVLSIAELNGHATSDAEVGETIDGSTGTDTLMIYGTVDLTGVTVLNIENIQINSTLTLTATQFALFTSIAGDGSSIINITNDTGADPLIIDLSSTSLTDIATLNTTGNIEIIVSSADDLSGIANLVTDSEVTLVLADDGTGTNSINLSDLAAVIGSVDAIEVEATVTLVVDDTTSISTLAISDMGGSGTIVVSDIAAANPTLMSGVIIDEDGGFVSASGTALVVENFGGQQIPDIDPSDIGVLPEISIADISVNEASEQATFTVSLNARFYETVTVDYTAPDGTTGTLTFAAGETTKIFNTAWVDDAIIEANEVVTATLSGATNATILDGSGSLTIIDDDVPPVIALSSLDGSNGFRLDGVVTTDWSGVSVSNAGDINGDGYDDLIIGAYGAGSNGNYSGSSYVVFGTGTAMAAIFDLSSLDGSNGFRIDGATADDRSGRSVSSAGDINGDGYDDLIVGAWGADNGGSSSGSSYVVFGTGALMPATLDLSTLDGSNGFRLDGVAGSDRSGRAVSSAGDVNGDGYDDLLIGAFTASPNGFYSGSSYVVFGTGAAMPAIFDLTTLDGSNGFALGGVTGGDRSGTAVSSAGDVNGDGYDDLIIGAPYADPNGLSSGSSYVVFGTGASMGATFDLSTLNGLNGFRIDGVIDNDLNGWSVSSAGDVNGDGYDDLIAVSFGTSYNGGSSGSTYIIYGTGSAIPPTINLSTIDGNNGFRIDGASALDSSGYSVSSAGDINGDGYDDILIGAYQADPNGVSLGASYVVFGTDAVMPASFDLSSLDGTNGFRLDGVAGAEQTGISVSSAGDVNGDGYDDLIIGAYGADPNGLNSGSSYVVYGGAQWGALAQAATVGDDTLTGTVVADTLIGGDGNDSLTGLGGADVLRGGAGDDTITVSDLHFVQVDGGLGSDTLAIEGTGLSLDLTSVGHGVDNIEIIDLTGTGDNSLTLSAAAISQHAGSNTLRVDGNSGDVITLTDYFNWTMTGSTVIGSVTYAVYTNGALTLQVAEVVAGPAPATISLGTLSDYGGFRIDGEAAFNWSGYSVSNAGDVNGDGYDDLIIGAYNANNGSAGSGSSYVVFGTGTLMPNTFNLSTLDGTNGFRIDGVAGGDGSGNSVSSAGDINGDGYDDLIIGAYRTDSNGVDSGSSYVVFGTGANMGASLNLSTLDGSNGFALNGLAMMDYFGRSVSNAGDINGDGYDDLIIGVNGADLNGFGSGSSYVVFGTGSAMGATFDLTTLDGSNGFRLDGVATLDSAGYSVSSAGDINGDGYDDLIIGAYGADPNGGYSGSSYVVYGTDAAMSATFDIATLDGSNGFRLDGAVLGDRSGFSVSSAGDVNGDGFDDLIIGAYSADQNDNYSGSTYVVYGTDSTMPATLDLSALDGSNGFRLDGEAADDASGYSVSSAGDINGDGYDDLLIGAYRADPAGGYSGSTYVVFGTDASTPATLNLSALDGSNGFRLDGVVGGDQSGYSVSSAGDINGDGYDDLIVGAYYADNGGTNTGSSYVVYGGAHWSASAQLATLGDDTLMGTASADTLIGGDGDDTLNGAGGVDVLRGGAGDDTITVTDLAFAQVDGGLGSDTLVLDGTELSLDLTSVGHGVDNFEIIDLTGTGDNSLTLSAAAISQHAGSNTLRVDGNNGDVVSLSDYANWAKSGTTVVNSITYDIYTNGAFTLQIAEGVAAPAPAEINLSTLSGTGGFRLDGVAVDDYTGYSVSNAGDVNGDGYDDLIIGSYYADNGGNDSGSSYVIYGSGSAMPAMSDLSVLNGTNGFRIDGVAASDFSGASVSSAGDINGDGYDDLIIGAYYADPNGIDSGSSYVVFGTATAMPAAFNLSTLDGSNGFRLDGVTAGDYSGISVSNAGDINGDGYDDLIIGAPYTDSNGVSSGSSYIVYGTAAAMPATFDLSTLDGSNGFRLDGVTAGDESAWTVSSAGDVNGDGYDDLVIGAMRADPNGNDSGSSYVVFGTGAAMAATFDLSTLDGSNGFRLDGVTAAESSGTSVSSAGDINGDGYDDLIIGAHTADPNGNNSGSTYIVFGTATAMPATFDLSTLDGSNGFRLDGLTTNDLFGNSVSSAGDINGDGYDDLIIGAWGADNGGSYSGSSYVVFGTDANMGATFDLSTLDGTNGIRLDGVTNDQSGLSLSAAGDVNGDGYDDLIIGAAMSDNGGSTTGSTYVVFGGSKWGASAQVATVGDDTLTGTAGADTLIGGDGDDIISGLAGDDIIKGGAGNDTITGGTGADDIYGGGNLDTFIFAAGDTMLSFGGAGDAGTISGYDTINDFSAGTGTVNSETIDTVGTASVVADTAGTDGADSTLTIAGATIKSHAITSGIVTFDDADTFAAGLVVSTNAEIAAVVEYLQLQDLGNAGATVAFDVGGDMYLFTQGDDIGTDSQDILVHLDDMQADSLLTVIGTGHGDLFIA